MTKLVNGAPTSRLKKLFVVSAAAALAVSGTLLGGATANAAEINLGPDQIAGWENGAEGEPGYNYDQWHIGSVTTPDTPVTESLTFNDNCSVTLNAVPEGESADWTQVLKGYPIDARPTGDSNGIEELRSTLESISLDVVSGSATVQIPIFIYGNFPDTDKLFTTFLNVTHIGPGHFQMEGSTPLTNTQLTSTLAPGTLDEVMVALEFIMGFGDESVVTKVEILGVGFNGSAGTEISSFGFDGNTYLFGTGCETAQPEQPEQQPEQQPTKPSEVKTAAL